MKRFYKYSGLVLLLIVVSSPVWAELTQAVKEVQTQWAKVNYMPVNNGDQKDAKEAAFEKL